MGTSPVVTEAAAGDLLCLAVGGCGGGGDPFFLPLFPSAAAQLADEIPDIAAAGRRRRGSGKERKRDDWEKLRETEREREGGMFIGGLLQNSMPQLPRENSRPTTSSDEASVSSRAGSIRTTRVQL